MSKSKFDSFAEHAAKFISSAKWFVFCVIVILTWLPSYFLFSNVESWQLPVNTITTIITFLMVAVLENSTRRDSTALNGKLDKVLEALDDLEEVHQDTRSAVGLEKEVGST